MHMAHVLEHRWVRRILAWNPSVADLWEGGHTRGIIKSTLFFLKGLGAMAGGDEIPSTMGCTL